MIKGKSATIHHFIKYFTVLFMMVAGVVTAVASNPQWEKFTKLKYRQPSANFTPGKFQSITGRFDGKTVDTITLFPYDGEWDGDEFYYDKWILISKNGTIPSHIIDSYWPTLVPEGDLDGNGRDEFGVTRTGHNSNWITYSVFTLYNRKVKSFLDVKWWEGNEEDYRSIVRKGTTKGEVKYTTYSWADDIIKQNRTTRITKFLK